MASFYPASRAATARTTNALARLCALALLACSLLFFAFQEDLAAQSDPARIVAIGDLHGDYEAFEDIALAAGIIDRKGRWAGGSTTYVQLGDIVDRGPDSLEIIEHLRKLEPQARKAGGEVVVLIGNHEAMNIIGDLRYVHPGEYDAFKTRASKQLRERIYEMHREKIEAAYLENQPEFPRENIKDAWMAANPLGKLEHRAAWAPDGDIGAWIAGKDAIARIGGTLFVHGGISAEIAARSIAEINRETRESLLQRRTGPESILESPLGPLWYRGNLSRPAPGLAAAPPEGAEGEAPPAVPERMSIADELSFVLERYDAVRLVIGHTPNLEGIAAKEGGRLVQADTGISRHYGGPRSYLELIGGRAIAHKKDAASGWVSTELPAPAELEKAE